ncbi:universal stress protein [Streptomyces sp. ODS28]|uniref:universal stress protein n=1 Tax=Streptomyces sp. ODS28 TaxID=3136688 RepID=UPI0031ED3093
MPCALTVGLDGSPASLAAADWAAGEALLREVPLRLLHAWNPGPYYASLAGAVWSQQELEAQREDAELRLDEAASRLARRHPGLRVSAHQYADDPVQVLLGAAEDAELLVLGSRGLARLTGFLLGSVALGVVSRTERPVVLVRGDERSGERSEGTHPLAEEEVISPGIRGGSIVLGLDLDNPHDAVLEFAFEEALRRAALLRVVHGWSLPPSFGYGGILETGANAEVAARVRRMMTEVLRTWQEKFPDVTVRTGTAVGGAGPALADASRDAALVVVGRRIRKSPLGSHIGPVTHAALHHAGAPVAVVPHH